MTARLNRRQMLKSMLAAGATATLAACAPKQEAAPSAAATAVPKKEAPPAAKAKTNLSIGTYADPRNEWQRIFAKEWAEENPEVELQIDEIVYGEMFKKQLTMLATDTMEDVVFSGIKWFPYVVYKGAFMPMTDLISAADPGMDDFFQASIDGSSFDGKVYGLPYLLHPGNPALILYNKNLLADKGVAEPTDDWDVMDFVEMAAKLSDPDNKVFGTNYLPGNYYDFCSLARSYEGDVLEELTYGKQFTFNTDPKSIEAAKWAVDVRTKYHAAPLREEGEGLQFAAGNFATSTAGTYSVRSLGETVGDKFDWGVVLFPKGPTGVRGYQGFVECFSIYSKSKQPQLAFDLTTKVTSTEAGVWAVVEGGQNPTARKSVWSDSTVLEVLDDVFTRAKEWMEGYNGPFPMPWNLRYTELNDTWVNTSRELLYGEVGFEEGMNNVQKECQVVMDLPRP